jgi:exodeoxyribonuclease VII large subunit
VGALCRAIADALDARFNPVEVRGELSGFSRATSGHCYFTLKDETGQIRCAMFRRAVGTLSFAPRDGDRVEIRGRLGVYEPRGELQLVVESMRPAGQGALFEQFLLLKAKLSEEGMFDAQRKRPLSDMPRGIGVVTSLGAAALHDVVTTLQRRVPHIPVVLAPSLVQGEGAAQELKQALLQLFALTRAQSSSGNAPAEVIIDTVLLVRGGGAMEDLWAFNDEELARTIAASPVPIISGVGHETDFTIADFVADVRAPTPTAAAELVCQPTDVLRSVVSDLEARIDTSVGRFLDKHAQRLDVACNRLGRPSTRLGQQRLTLASLGQRLYHATRAGLVRMRGEFERSSLEFPNCVNRAHRNCKDRTERTGMRLILLDPALVLQRGYAWLSDEQGQTVSSVAQAAPGQCLHATLSDGVVDLSVLGKVSV